MELYARHKGMFLDRTETINRNINFSGKSTEEIDREIRRLAEAQGMIVSKGTATKQ